MQEDNNGRSSVFQLRFIFQNLAKRIWSRSKELEVEVEVEKEVEKEGGQGQINSGFLSVDQREECKQCKLVN